MSKTLLLASIFCCYALEVSTKESVEFLRKKKLYKKYARHAVIGTAVTASVGMVYLMVNAMNNDSILATAVSIKKANDCKAGDSDDKYCNNIDETNVKHSCMKEEIGADVLGEKCGKSQHVLVVNDDKNAAMIKETHERKIAMTNETNTNAHEIAFNSTTVCSESDIDENVVHGFEEGFEANERDTPVDDVDFVAMSSSESDTAHVDMLYMVSPDRIGQDRTVNLTELSEIIAGDSLKCGGKDFVEFIDETGEAKKGECVRNGEGYEETRVLYRDADDSDVSDIDCSTSEKMSVNNSFLQESNCTTAACLDRGESALDGSAVSANVSMSASLGGSVKQRQTSVLRAKVDLCQERLVADSLLQRFNEDKATFFDIDVRLTELIRLESSYNGRDLKNRLFALLQDDITGIDVDKNGFKTPRDRMSRKTPRRDGVNSRGDGRRFTPRTPRQKSPNIFEKFTKKMMGALSSGSEKAKRDRSEEVYVGDMCATEKKSILEGFSGRRQVARKGWYSPRLRDDKRAESAGSVVLGMNGDKVMRVGEMNRYDVSGLPAYSVLHAGSKSLQVDRKIEGELEEMVEIKSKDSEIDDVDVAEVVSEVERPVIKMFF